MGQLSESDIGPSHLEAYVSQTAVTEIPRTAGEIVDAVIAKTAHRYRIHDFQILNDGEFPEVRYFNLNIGNRDVIVAVPSVFLNTGLAYWSFEGIEFSFIHLEHPVWTQPKMKVRVRRDGLITGVSAGSADAVETSYPYCVSVDGRGIFQQGMLTVAQVPSDLAGTATWGAFRTPGFSIAFAGMTITPINEIFSVGAINVQNLSLPHT